MIQHFENTYINTLGESRKPIDEYTLYSYLELKTKGELTQLRDVFVHDSVNAGLLVGEQVDLAIATMPQYSTFSISEPMNECIFLKTDSEERTNFITLIEQLKRKPSYPKVIFWIITMPLRVFGSCLRKVRTSGLGGLIGTFALTYFSLFLAPIVEPYTFIKRRRIYRELSNSSHEFLSKARSKNYNSAAYDQLSENIHSF